MDCVAEIVEAVDVVDNELISVKLRCFCVS